MDEQKKPEPPQAPKPPKVRNLKRLTPTDLADELDCSAKHVRHLIRIGAITSRAYFPIGSRQKRFDLELVKEDLREFYGHAAA